MSINKIVQPYEFLVRINDGEISGAHVRRLEVVKDTETGEVFSAKELPAEPIELTEAEKSMISARLA